MASSPIRIDQQDANLYRIGAGLVGGALGVLVGLIGARLLDGIESDFAWEQAANWVSAGFGFIVALCFYVLAAFLIRIYVVVSENGAGGSK